MDDAEGQWIECGPPEVKLGHDPDFPIELTHGDTMHQFSIDDARDLIDDMQSAIFEYCARETD